MSKSLENYCHFVIGCVGPFDGPLGSADQHLERLDALLSVRQQIPATTMCMSVLDRVYAFIETHSTKVPIVEGKKHFRGNTWQKYLLRQSLPTDLDLRRLSRPFITDQGPSRAKWEQMGPILRTAWIMGRTTFSAASAHSHGSPFSSHSLVVYDAEA